MPGSGRTPAKEFRVGGSHARQQLKPTSARRGELFAELRHHERTHPSESQSGTPIPNDSRVSLARPHPIGLAAMPWPEVFSECRSLTEAAHVPSKYLTEPMRCRHRRPRLAPLSMRRSLACPPRPGPAVKATRTLRGSSSPFCLAGTWHGEVSGARPAWVEWEGSRDESIHSPLAPLSRPSVEAVDVWERKSARPRIAVWCRLGIFTEARNSEPRTIPAQKLADSGSVC